MGLDEGETPHPEMLLDLARGVGFSEGDLVRLKNRGGRGAPGIWIGEGALREP